MDELAFFATPISNRGTANDGLFLYKRSNRHLRHRNHQNCTAGNKREQNVGALPTELQMLAHPEGLEPSTSRLRGEVTVLYATAIRC